uniref:Uncharacterized protein n=1 Tax=Anopheles coluzzii TaxID=1518534 RepID=A0A8W7P9C0_ANOCL
MSTTSSWDDSVKMSSNNAPNSAATTPSTGGTTVQTESTKCGGSYGAPSSPIALEEGGCPPIKVAAGDEEPTLQRPATPPPRAYHCGWFALRPKWMERFMTPKWALFWLCWAGAVQGQLECIGRVSMETVTEKGETMDILEKVEVTSYYRRTQSKILID